MSAYSDIITLSRPVSAQHPQMRRADRAKQFMPFAALTGYDDEIRGKETLYEPFRELGEEQRDRLDARLNRLRDMLLSGRRPVISLEYFVPAPRQSDPWTRLGQYRIVTGPARKMDTETGLLRVDGQAVPLADITGLWIER